MAKGGQKQTTSSGLTGSSLAMQNDIYGAARNAANNYTTVGPNAGTTQAMQGYGQYAQAGANGLAALGGDSAQMGKLMNPYQNQVMDQMMNRYGQLSQRLGNAGDANATMAGAFGGSRHGIASGVAQGELAQGQAGQMGQMLQQGYQNAQGVAGQLAGMGMQANGAMDETGRYIRDINQQQANPEMMRAQILAGGMAGGGDASKQETTQLPGTSAFQNIAGLGMMGASLFGGGGAMSGLFHRGTGAGGGSGMMPSQIPSSWQPHNYSNGLNWGMHP